MHLSIRWLPEINWDVQWACVFIFSSAYSIDWTWNQPLNSVDNCVRLKRSKKKLWLHAASERKQYENDTIKSVSVCIILTNIVCDKTHFSSLNRSKVWFNFAILCVVVENIAIWETLLFLLSLPDVQFILRSPVSSLI